MEETENSDKNSHIATKNTRVQRRQKPKQNFNSMNKQKKWWSLFCFFMNECESTHIYQTVWNNGVEGTRKKERGKKKQKAMKKGGEWFWVPISQEANDRKRRRSKGMRREKKKESQQELGEEEWMARHINRQTALSYALCGLATWGSGWPSTPFFLNHPRCIWRVHQVGEHRSYHCSTIRFEKQQQVRYRQSWA